MSVRTRSTILSSILVSAILSSCTSSNPANPLFLPDPPTAWSSAVTNSFFPLEPGSTFSFRGETEDGVETILKEVLPGTRTVNGVTATVVRDRVFLDGELVEDTFDWYAQDIDGNVWYLGEDSKDFEDGEVVSTKGSWEWGVDGAIAGIIMWADPVAHVNEAYRQEYYEGEAEDWGMVVGVEQTVTVVHGTFSGCVETEDWNGLEEDAEERKFYCPGLGAVLEYPLDDPDERIELESAESGA